MSYLCVSDSAVQIKVRSVIRPLSGRRGDGDQVKELVAQRCGGVEAHCMERSRRALHGSEYGKE